MYEHEIYGLKRLIAYIEKVDHGHSVQQLSGIESRQKDFYNFYSQYSRRRNKDINEYFDDWPQLLTWLNTLKGNNQVHKVDSLIDANAVDWGQDIVKNVLSNAIKNGSKK